MNVRFSDEKHVWIDGKQYIRLDRFLEVVNGLKETLAASDKRCKELSEYYMHMNSILKSGIKEEMENYDETEMF